jgi:SPP1 family predicted phage head-tail adaptor
MTAPIGSRRRRFVLEIPLETPDGFGGVLRSFVPGPQLWGSLELVSAGERQRADRAEQAATHRVRLRHRDGVTGAMQLSLGLRRFAILSAADPDGRRRELTCLVEEVTP